MADELLDLVDKDDNVIGTVKRSVARQDPSKIFRTVSLAIFNDFGETLIRKRAKNKTHAGEWGNAVWGHVLAHEAPEKSVERELFEELGIKSSPIYHNKMFIKTNDRSRFMWVYYTVVPSTIKLVIDKDEIEETRWIKPKDLLQFSKTNEWNINDYSHKAIMEVDKILNTKK